MDDTNLGALFVNQDSMDLVKTMEETGYSVLFCAEGQGFSAFSRLHRYAPVTETLTLSTGIVNIFSRSPSVIAQEIASLDSYSRGRAMLGLGVAHPAVSEDFHGIPFNKPISRLEEYVILIRRYLAGNADGYDGEFFHPKRTSFWEMFEPYRNRIPIYNGAVGEQNIKKTGELLDGWLPVFYPFNQLPNAFEWLEEGAKRSGRDHSEINKSLVVITAVGEDSDAIRRVAGLQIATYLRDVPGYYDRVARQSGLSRSIEEVLNAPSTEEAAESMSHELIDALAVVGSLDQVRERFREISQSYDLDRLVVFVPAWADQNTRKRTIQSIGERFER